MIRLALAVDLIRLGVPVPTNRPLSVNTCLLLVIHGGCLISGIKGLVQSEWRRNQSGWRVWSKMRLDDAAIG